MRDIPSGLAAHIEAGATTLCHCWSLTRRDGLVLGFTDHDRKLSFDGIDFAATTGLEAAESAAELGFVALSQVADVKGGSRWIVPAGLHAPIDQQAVLLKAGAASPAAKAFVAFLKGGEARAIIRKYGYEVP